MTTPDTDFEKLYSRIREVLRKAQESGLIDAAVLVIHKDTGKESTSIGGVLNHSGNKITKKQLHRFVDFIAEDYDDFEEDFYD